MRCLILALLAACVPDAKDATDTAADTATAGATAADSASDADTGADTGPAADTGPDTAADAGPDTAADSGDTASADGDGDGITVEAGDCDDADPAVHPGADDPNGDGLDADCDGDDGAPYVGCSPIDVPDVYATVEDAIAALEPEICLGEGTFDAVGPVTADTFYIFGIYGQGRDRTVLNDPTGALHLYHYEGMTLTGAVDTRGESLYLRDVTAEGLAATFNTAFVCERCVLDGATFAATSGANAVVLRDSWVYGGDVGVSIAVQGCGDPHSCAPTTGALAVENCTFTGTDTAIAVDAQGYAHVTVDVRNSVFVDVGALYAAEIDTAASARVTATGEANLVWSAADLGNAPFPYTEADPLLDDTFAPPRPAAGSPAVDAAGADATATDFWGVARATPDIGAVER